MVLSQPLCMLGGFIGAIWSEFPGNKKTSWQKEGLGLEGFLLLGFFRKVQACVFTLAIPIAS